MTHRHPVLTYGWRYLAGRPLSGRPAAGGGTWLHAGTRPSGAHASRWALLPGRVRTAYRLGVPAAVVALVAAHSAAPGLTDTSASVAAVVLTTRGARAARDRLRLRRFTAAYITPTVAAVTPPLGGVRVTLTVSPELGQLTPRLARALSPAEIAVRRAYGARVEPVLRWVPERVMRVYWAAQRRTAPATRRLEWFRRPVETSGARIRLTADTPYLTAEQRKLTSAIVQAKVPVSDLVETWDQVGSAVTATWTVRRRPPDRAGRADLAAVFDRLDDWEFFLGLGVDGRPVTVSLHDDSPHIACSAASGAGKSVLAALVAAQVLARGGRVIILDFKGSHRWARGGTLPGVTYCLHPAEMHDALIATAVTARDRNTAALDAPDDWAPAYRILVVAEELNATIGQLQDYWVDIREKGDPKVSPAIRALRELLYTGRSASVHVFGVAQMLSARSIGGPEARENFGIRCLARYTANAWKMLVPEAHMPRASRTQGRWQIVVGGVATECQVAYLTPGEVRAFVAVHVSTKQPEWGLTSNVHVDMDNGDPLSELVSLRQAIDEGLIPWTMQAVQKRLQRARKAGEQVPAVGGRAGGADLFRRGDLIVWVESERVARGR